MKCMLILHNIRSVHNVATALGIALFRIIDV